MSDELARAISIPPTVVVREVDGEAVILDLDSELYFGLDDVGTDMWRALSESASIAVAIDSLAAEYDVDKDRLRDDVLSFVRRLEGLGLLVVDAG